MGYDITREALSAQLERYQDSEHSFALVAHEGEHAVGLIGGHLIPLLHQSGNAGRITAFIVSGSVRGSGVGTQLLTDLEAIFLQNNCLRIEVTSGDHRVEALEFYKSKGYVPDERRFIKNIFA